MHHEPHEQQFSQMINDLYDIISHGQAGNTYLSCIISLNRLIVNNRQIDVKNLDVPLYSRHMSTVLEAAIEEERWVYPAPS